MGITRREVLLGAGGLASVLLLGAKEAQAAAALAPERRLKIVVGGRPSG